MTRRLSLLGMVIAACLMLAGPGARAQTSMGDPKVFIENLADRAVAALTVKDISRDERTARLRLLLNENFDIETIGRWVLGRYWRQATPAERDEYLRLFEALIVDTYVDRFANYSGEKLSVTKVQPIEDRDSLVFSIITRPAVGQPLRVDWRLRDEDGRFRVVDVMVEGVSMGQAQRAEFASVIRQSGGKVEDLLDKLRARQ